VLDRLLADAPKEPRGLLLFALVRDLRTICRQPRCCTGAIWRSIRDVGFALHRLGHILQRRGHDAAACLSFAQAVAAQPGHAATFNDFGAALYRMGDVEHALAAFAGLLGVQCQRNPAERITTA
jgi:hypothetical protein